jgi:hypothetical protein
LPIRPKIAIPSNRDWIVWEDFFFFAGCHELVVEGRVVLLDEFANPAVVLDSQVPY